jgi:hypothetical protein
MLNLAGRLHLTKQVITLICIVHAVAAHPAVKNMGQPEGGLELARSTDAPVITDLVPNRGPIGTVVVIRGRNFTLKNNVIEFKGKKEFAAESPVGSENGTRLRFRVTSCPATQPQCPGFYIPPGVYHVTVINADGQSNSLTFLLISHETAPGS